MTSGNRDYFQDRGGHRGSDNFRGGFKGNRGKFDKKSSWKPKDKGMGGKDGGFGAGRGPSGRGGGSGGGGGKRKAGNMRNQAKLLEYKKFLPLCMDKRLQVKLTCERFVIGTLEGYDPLDNITLANASDKESNENLGTIMIRGSAIERIEALEDMDEKPNFSRLGVNSRA